MCVYVHIIRVPNLPYRNCMSCAPLSLELLRLYAALFKTEYIRYFYVYSVYLAAEYIYVDVSMRPIRYNLCKMKEVQMEKMSLLP